MFGLQNFPQSISLPNNSNHPWKGLMRSMVIAKNDWCALKGDVFTPEDLKILQSTLLTNLLDPSIPAPILRREPKSYPTVVQDILANELFPSDALQFPQLPGEDEELLLKLDDSA